MRISHNLKRLRRILLVGLVMVFVLVPITGAMTAPDDHAEAPNVGIVCTENPTATFTLSARDGYISMPDGNTIYMWSFAPGTDDFQFPGPVLCVNEGDTVTVVLHNQLPQDVSIIFPGQENVLANNVPSQPVFDAGELVSLAPSAAANGGSITYSFVAEKPGTFLYESGTNPAIQTQMGLAGTLVVRPAMGANYAYNDPLTQFNPDTEYLVMLGEIDPLLHQAIERGETFDMRNYVARYFTINGRSFPDTLAPNVATWLPNQPYSSFAHISPFDDRVTVDGQPNPAYNPYPALSRYVGTGVDDYPFHPHAFNARIIGRDGNLIIGPNGEDITIEKFSIPIGPGQTTDTLFQWQDTESWTPDNINPVPIDLPLDQNLTAGLFWAGSPYLGNQDALPTGTQSYNQCGEFYHIAHNHALQQITGWGVVLIGQVTFTRIDPPKPNNCP